MALTAKQRKMIDSYLKGASKSDAMREAGYSEGTATTRHSYYFGHPEVVAEIERRQKIASTRADISLEKLNAMLMEIATANLGDLLQVDDQGNTYMDYDKLTPELRKAISNLTVDEVKEGRGEDAKIVKRVRIGVLDRVRAIEQLIRHNGLSKEKIVVNHEGDLVEALQRGRARARQRSEDAPE